MMFSHVCMRSAIVCGLAAACGPVFWLCGIRAGVSQWISIALTLVMMIAALSGFLSMLFARLKFRRRPQMVRAGRLIVAGLWLAAAIAWLPFDSVWLRVIGGLWFGIGWYGGCRLSAVSLDRLSHPYILTGICLFDTASGILCHAFEPNASLVPVLCILAANLLCDIAARNVLAMERFLSNGGESTQGVPNGVRRHNLRLLLGFCVASVAVMLFVVPLSKFLGWVGRWIAAGAWYVLRDLLRSDGETAEPTPPEPVARQVTQVEQNTAADWVWIGFCVVIVGGLVIVLIRNRRDISEMLLSLWDRFRRWAAARRRHRPLMASDEPQFYAEFVEDLLTDQKMPPEQPLRMTRRRWNRAYRQYRRMPYDATRFRLGFSLMLARFPADCAKATDSTGEILQNLVQTGQAPPHWDTLTRDYDAVRYGEKPPTADAFAALDAALETKT